MSNQTVLFFLGTREDEPYLHRLQGLTAGQQVAWKFFPDLRTPDTIAEVELLCKKAGISGIVCSNQVILEKLLRQQVDFIPPPGKKQITLDDYQGSLLHTRLEKLPVVFINPLANLVTVPYATPAAKRFIKKLASPSSWFQQTAFTWEILEAQKFSTVLKRLEAATLIAVDIETPVPNPLRAINCVGYCAYFKDTNTTECYVVPITDMFALSMVRQINATPAPKVMQNGLYDALYFLRFNAPLFNWLHDTQHLFHSWYSEYPKRLDFITAFSLRNVRYWKDDGKTGNLTDYYRYNAQDCWATCNSYLALLAECDDFALTNYVEEFPLVFPALTCELEGIAVDWERFEQVKKSKEVEVMSKEHTFQRMIAASNFNVNSPLQVKSLFAVLGLKNLPDTAAASMLKAQASSPFNNRILSELTSIKKTKKLLSTYLVPEKFWNGRVYYKLNPAGTDTGRLASTESSFWCGLQIQNIPRGDSIKQFLVSDSGWLLSEVDKAQSEARCVGYLSGETKLIELLEGPHEFHSWNAAAFFGVPYEAIYDEATGKKLNVELRDLAKRTNHGANYNMGPGVMLDTMGPKNVAKAKVLLKLSGTLKQVCQFLLDTYSNTYPKVKGLWYESIVKSIMLTGKLISPLGHVRVFFGKPQENKLHLNAAVAHPAQNLSVAIINKEFYNVWSCQIYGGYHEDKKFIPYDLRNIIRLKAQIHDSIFFQYRVSRPDAPKLVEQLMQTRVTIRGADGVTRTMLLPSDISAGKTRWSELK